MIASPDVPDVYTVPQVLQREGLDELVCERLGIETTSAELGEWLELEERIASRTGDVTIALVGKYVKLHDAYLSVHEALKHAGVHHGVRVHVRWVDAENMSYEEAVDTLDAVDGVLVPGGFGSRGWEGKILACHVAGKAASRISGSASACTSPSPSSLGTSSGSTAPTRPRWTPRRRIPSSTSCPSRRRSKTSAARCGSARRRSRSRLGRARDAYGEAVIHERHRHRYEVNNVHRPRLVDAGLIVSGTFQEGRLEIVELPTTRGSSRAVPPRVQVAPTRPAPLFRDFVGAALDRAAERLGVEVTVG